MGNSEEQEALRQALEFAPVVGEFEMAVGPSRCSQTMQWVILEGDIRALWKWGVTEAEGRHEVAAYELASILGWAQYLPVTVERTATSATGNVTVASIEFLPGMTIVPQIEGFSTGEIQRAAVFDQLIANDDRSHNWGGIPDPNGPGLQLRLFDHEGAFKVDGNVASAFVAAVGGTISDERKAELRRARPEIRASHRLRHLLDPPEHSALLTRLDQLSA